jgi:Uncharacterized protein, linocin/CFP29 homolog
MPKQRNKFFTFVFSFFPGAGHMFMGFMKIGLTLMAGFLLIIFLSSWLDLGPLMYIQPILIFYSVFDCINKDWASPEEFARFEDRSFFSGQQAAGLFGFLKGRGRIAAGVVIVFIGCEILLKNIVNSYTLERILPHMLYSLLSVATNTLPQIVVSAAIIGAGLYLIIGKKRGGIDDRK